MSGYRRLKEFFRSRAAGGIALAFSGGVDSLLLLEVLRLLRQEEPFPLAAMTIHSPFHREEETDRLRSAGGSRGPGESSGSLLPVQAPYFFLGSRRSGGAGAPDGGGRYQRG